VSDPVFLSLDEILRIHTRSLAEHGGLEGVRDPGLVESALASGRNTFLLGQGDLFDIAASYAFHLSEAQAFIDGNKRTAAAAALIFLARNGVYVRPPQLQMHQAMLDIANKLVTKSDIANLFRQLVQLN